MKACDVAIIGAGPYGLSIAAHLKAAGVDFESSASPWICGSVTCPKACILSPRGLPQAFLTLAEAFHSRPIAGSMDCPTGALDPLCPSMSSALTAWSSSAGLCLSRTGIRRARRREGTGFSITLGNGEVFYAQRVVVAVGLTHYAYLPEELACLPAKFVSHSYKHGELDGPEDKEVGILGAGASALSTLRHYFTRQERECKSSRVVPASVFTTRRKRSLHIAYGLLHSQNRSPA